MKGSHKFQTLDVEDIEWVRNGGNRDVIAFPRNFQGYLENQPKKNCEYCALEYFIGAFYWKINRIPEGENSL